MFQRLKAQWHDLSDAKPGRRFQERYERRKGRRSGWWRPLYVVFGIALCLAGLVLMPAPGPGLIVVFIGGAMIAEESLVAARVLDWAELKLRAVWSRLRRIWRRASGAVKAVVAVCGAALAAAAGVAAYVVFIA